MGWSTNFLSKEISLWDSEDKILSHSNNKMINASRKIPERSLDYWHTTHLLLNFTEAQLVLLLGPIEFPGFLALFSEYSGRWVGKDK